MHTACPARTAIAADATSGWSSGEPTTVGTCVGSPGHHLGVRPLIRAPASDRETPPCAPYVDLRAARVAGVRRPAGLDGCLWALSYAVSTSAASRPRAATAKPFSRANRRMLAVGVGVITVCQRSSADSGLGCWPKCYKPLRHPALQISMYEERAARVCTGAAVGVAVIPSITPAMFPRGPRPGADEIGADPAEHRPAWLCLAGAARRSVSAEDARPVASPTHRWHRLGSRPSFRADTAPLRAGLGSSMSRASVSWQHRLSVVAA